MSARSGNRCCIPLFLFLFVLLSRVTEGLIRHHSIVSSAAAHLDSDHQSPTVATAKAAGSVEVLFNTDAGANFIWKEYLRQA